MGAQSCLTDISFALLVLVDNLLLAILLWQIHGFGQTHTSIYKVWAHTSIFMKMECFILWFCLLSKIGANNINWYEIYADTLMRSQGKLIKKDFMTVSIRRLVNHGCIGGLEGAPPAGCSSHSPAKDHSPESSARRASLSVACCRTTPSPPPSPWTTGR